MSLFELLKTPEDVQVLLYSIGLILLVSFYFSGADFGIIRIPEFGKARRTSVMLAGVVITVGCVLASIPILPNGDDRNPSETADASHPTAEIIVKSNNPTQAAELTQTFTLAKVETIFGSSEDAQSIEVNLENDTLYLGVSGGLYQYNLVNRRGQFDTISAADGNSIEKAAIMSGDIMLSLSTSGQLDRIVNRQAKNVMPDTRVLDFVIAQDANEAGVILEGNGVRTLDLPGGQPRLHLGGMPWTSGATWFSKIAMPHSGLLIAVARSYGAVFLFDQEADFGPKEIAKAQGNGIAALTFSPDGSALAIAFRSGRLILWDVQAGKKAMEWQEQGYLISSIDFSPRDESWIAIGGYGLDRKGRVGLIKVGKGLVKSIASGGPVRDITFSRDGKEIFAVGQTPPLRIFESGIDS